MHSVRLSKMVVEKGEGMSRWGRMMPDWWQQATRVDLLSAREKDVLWLLGAGCSNRAISVKLQVTERTVKAHVARILTKLEVESRLQAGLVSYAYHQRKQPHLHRCRIGQEAGRVMCK